MASRKDVQRTTFTIREKLYNAAIFCERQAHAESRESILTTWIFNKNRLMTGGPGKIAAGRRNKSNSKGRPSSIEAIDANWFMVLRQIGMQVTMKALILQQGTLFPDEVASRSKSEKYQTFC